MASPEVPQREMRGSCQAPLVLARETFADGRCLQTCRLSAQPAHSFLGFHAILTEWPRVVDVSEPVALCEVLYTGFNQVFVRLMGKENAKIVSLSQGNETMFLVDGKRNKYVSGTKMAASLMAFFLLAAALNM